MQYGIPLIPIIPMRNTPAEASEMVSQVLFGEIFQILETQKKWTYIKLDFDGYEGWIDAKTWGVVTKETNTNPIVITDNLYWQKTSVGLLPLSMGSELHQQLKKVHPYAVQPLPPMPTEHKKVEIARLAQKFLHTPYLWGGRSAFGIDCSGLTQVVMKAAGISLPRDASQQALKGTTIDFVKDAMPGDLAFFDDTEGQITHVGILLNANEIIHASGMVQINKFDHQGIFHPYTNQYTHKLRIIKRLKYRP